MTPPENLTGGNMSSVQRIGDTVHRTSTPASPTIQRLLTHIRSKGITWVPKPLGFDDQGREVLSYVSGQVVHDMPDWIWSEPILKDIAKRLRAFHDATLEFDQTGALWNFPSREPKEVIVHHDFAPYNCVFENEQFVGLIDFDLCAPGPRIWDIAYAAYRFVPLLPASGPENWDQSPFDEPEMLRRLDLFVNSYNQGTLIPNPTSKTVLDTAKLRLEVLAEWTQNHARQVGSGQLEDNAKMYTANAKWLGRYSSSATSL
ncbi:MAG TPA: phosphotransferase [Fimbriimonas sp.]|nr:phosphotransferase [Fimbriimonas sp.]